MGNELSVGSRHRPARLALPGPTQFGSGAASSQSQQMPDPPPPPRSVSVPADYVSYEPSPVEFVVPGSYSAPLAPVVEEFVTPAVAAQAHGHDDSSPEGQEGHGVSGGPMTMEPAPGGGYQLSRPQGLIDHIFDARVTQARSSWATKRLRHCGENERCLCQDRFAWLVDNLKTPNYEIRNLPKGTKNVRADIRWMFLGFDPRPGQSWLLLLTIL